MNNTKLQSENTKKLLNSISKHLSGRKDCKGVEYKVRICIEDPDDPYSKYETTQIKFTPEIRVLPNARCRADYQKENIVYHVLTRHFNDLFEGIRPSGNCSIYKDAIVPGIYVYRISANGKYRRWERLR